MIGSAKVLTISAQKWTFWVNSLTSKCCAERGRNCSDSLENLNLCSTHFPQWMCQTVLRSVEKLFFFEIEKHFGKRFFLFLKNLSFLGKIKIFS